MKRGWILSTSILILSLSLVSSSYAYTKNRGENGKTIKWPDGTQSLDFVFYANNATENLIFSQAASQWSSTQDISISTSFGAGAPAANENSVSFSSDPAFFGGGGVAAVTNVVYDYDSGRILESDILINQSMTFTTDPDDFGDYLGDVLSHELGHALGLAHSEVKHSTMFYWLTKGQHSLSSDDKAGGYAIYPDAALGSRGKITGKVSGGDNVGIFGAHVQAISEANGEVLGSTLTLANGTFEIEGLPLNDNYFLYVSPIKVKASMPEYYKDIRTDFCTSSSAYRGAFYQTCRSSDKGYPQAVNLSAVTQNVNAGTLSIRCNLDVPVDYMNDKVSSFSVDSVDLSGNPGNAMVGYIEPSQLASRTPEYLNLDLTNFNSAAAANLYLEFKITYQSLYSVMHLQAEIERNGLALAIQDNMGNNSMVLGGSERLDSDGNPVLDLLGRVPLSITPSANTFDLMITPQSLEDWTDSLGSSYSDEMYYSRKSLFADQLSFYFLSYRVVQWNGSSFVAYAGPDYSSISNNNQCLDAPGSYSITANVQSSSNSGSGNRRPSSDDGGFACGSVNISNNGGGPGSGTFLSFLIGLMIIVSSKRRGTGRNHLV